ncbi:MAG: phosphoserine transaminase [Alphaproteobacteria bacterium]|nr:phosphoserine transaminase [Alphaproteobacteria bacterium]
MPPKPNLRPRVANFSSGPCAKRPGWTTAALAGALVGRSHRSPAGRARLAEVIERSRRMFEVPASHRIAIVPASDTGAVEMALWSLLGARGVDALAWESFGSGWVGDIRKELKLTDVRVLEADYGRLPDLGTVDFGRDVIFTWNGTTSGVAVPDGDWIAADRQGLTICDATSAVGAMELPWDKLDVVTWSWQKVLGGEAAHGMLVLGPRAVARLESHTPPWPLPKLFRMTKDGKLNEAIFAGETINTPSMLCVEDVIDALKWAESIGGGPGLRQRARRNLAVIERWVEATPAVAFLAQEPRFRSCTSVCLQFVDPWFTGLDKAGRAAAARAVAGKIEAEGAGYDIGAYRSAPPGLRLWTGATVETDDVAALLPWIDWAFATVKAGASHGSGAEP